MLAELEAHCERKWIHQHLQVQAGSYPHDEPTSSDTKGAVAADGKGERGGEKCVVGRDQETDYGRKVEIRGNAERARGYMLRESTCFA